MAKVQATAGTSARRNDRRGRESSTARASVLTGPIDREDVTDNEARLAQLYAHDATDNGIVVLDGMGCALRVDRGALVAEDGVGRYRRVRCFDRATHGLRRVVVIGSSAGFVTLEALAWLRHLHVPVLVLAPDGVPTLASTPRMTDDARLRRQQVLAAEQPVGLDLARQLIEAKIVGQARLLVSRFAADDEAATLLDLAEAVCAAGDVEEVRQIEASAAALYWQSWAGRPECAPQFATKDRRRCPPHWFRYEGRRSVLASANANRRAERPTNAVVNYLAALLQCEAILACAAVGLDAGFGLVHNEAKSRQSLALDLIEPLRPEAEGYVLDLFSSRVLRKSELVEAPDGHVRLRGPLTHELAETMPRWAQLVAPWAETVAHTLGDAMAGKCQPTTPLTGQRSKAAQAVVMARKAATKRAGSSSTTRQRPIADQSPSLWSCPDCGGPVLDPSHVRCESCMTADPRQTPALRESRRRAITARKRALREWDEAHPRTVHDSDYFRREVLPRLATVKLSEIMAAAGISKGFASDIRRGRYQPHVSAWAALARLVGAPPLPHLEGTGEGNSP